MKKSIEQFVDWDSAPEESTRCVIIRTWFGPNNELVDEEQLADISRPKPNPKINVNGILVENGVDIQKGELYYSPDTTKPECYSQHVHQLTTDDFYRIRIGITYKTKELAISRAHAMLSIIQD